MLSIRIHSRNAWFADSGSVFLYDDILTLAKEYDLSWATWDYDSGTFGYVSAIETARIPGAHYQKIGENRYVAKEVKDVLQKYMNWDEKYWDCHESVLWIHIDIDTFDKGESGYHD